MSIELPPTPATELEARKLANQIAYGFEKHKDDYWADRYDQDRLYYFRRMLGWQAEGGQDEAVYGLYAVPPKPWHAAEPVPTPTPVPEPPAPPDVPYGDMQDILAVVNRIEVKAELLATKADIAELRDEVKAAVKQLPAMLATLGLGGLLGTLGRRDGPRVSAMTPETADSFATLIEALHQLAAQIRAEHPKGKK